MGTRRRENERQANGQPTAYWGQQLAPPGVPLGFSDPQTATTGLVPIEVTVDVRMEHLRFFNGDIVPSPPGIGNCLGKAGWTVPAWVAV